MKPWLFTAYERQTDQGVTQILSIFLGASGISLEELDADLVRQLQRMGPVDAIYFVGYAPEIAAMRGSLGSRDAVFLDRLHKVTGGKNRGLMFFSFDPETGTHTCTDRAVKEQAGTVGLIDEERRRSLIAVFRNAGGEERAPIGTHYAKTSDRHCDRFLRVSNVLEDGNNVRLLAFWLMPHLWKTTTKSVIVDTSGIYSVALTALNEASRLGGLGIRPQVWSHRSHEGVDELPPRVAEDAVFVVSASTSNGLVRKLLRRGARANKIATLFSLSDDQIDGHTVLCDLRGDGETGLKPIKNEDARDCSWCRQNFHLIGIRGDQFSIAPPRVTTVEIRGTDLQDKVRSALSGLAGLGAFFAYRRRDGDRLCSLGIDVAPILQGQVPEKSFALVQRIREKWSSMMRRSQTTSLRNVVAASYPRSGELAASLVEDAKHRMADPADLQVVNAIELRDLAPLPGTSTIVVSACVDESQELLSVSRTLRDVQDSGTTAYLAVVQLLAPKQLGDRLKSNLTYGTHGAETFSYFSALDIPVDGYEDEPTWRAELTALQRLRSWADAQATDVPPELEARIERLNQAPAHGLTEDLFWPDKLGQPLQLRSDFTLIDGALREPRASQADLYAIMCVVLTALRHNNDSSRRLAHNAYQRGVLSPSNFDRFNDGVLQACLLRAARPKELAYAAGEEHLSEQMLGILMDGLPNSARPEKSEALIEFLIALMTGRVTLARPQLQRYLDSLVEATDASWPLAALVGRYMRAAVLGRSGESQNS
jgi:hypothetical protein